jgi:hypothetical protein
MKLGSIILQALVAAQKFKILEEGSQTGIRRINSFKPYTQDSIIASTGKKTTPLFKQNIFSYNPFESLPVFLNGKDGKCKKHIVTTISAKNHNKLCEYQKYINKKKVALNKRKISFIEKEVSRDKKNINNGDKNFLLIYDTTSEVKKFNNKVEIDDDSYRYKNYVCQDFAVAVANGAKPSEFNSIEAIKAHPALAYQHINNFYTKIAKEAYYFNIDQLATVLKSITYAIYKKDQNITKGYVFFYDLHAMAINITKQKTAIEIQFYDPNKTNVAKKVIIFHPEDTESLNINDFILQLEKIIYFPSNKAVLLSSEKVTKTSAVTVKILGDVSEMDLGFLLAFGQYSKKLNIPDDIIIKPMISQSHSVTRAIISWAFPSLTAKIPYYYKQVSGFVAACHSKHLDAISNYVDDVLSSNHSIEDKISAIYSDGGCTYIKSSIFLGEDNLWEVVIKGILKNKHISSSEKVLFLSAISEEYKLPVVAVSIVTPVFAENDKTATKIPNTEAQLATLKKLVNYILTTDNLTEAAKIQLIKGNPVQDYFWIRFTIDFKSLEKNFLVFSTYLEIILNCDKISESTKNSLLDLHVKHTEKEKILYEEAIKAENFKFAISYIEQITKSSLSLTAKQQLLHIENKDTFLALCTELEKTNPELAELYIQVVNKNTSFQG